MILRYGNMWTEFGGHKLFVITINGTLDKAGRLVMGAGIAKQASMNWPRLPMAMGHALRFDGARVKAHVYKLPFYVFPDSRSHTTLATLQTKYHFREMASLDLIREGIGKLAEWVAKNPSVPVNMPMPGVGYGRQPVDRVLPIIECLPDTVSVWQFSENKK